jgi:hypothetical protein
LNPEGLDRALRGLRPYLGDLVLCGAWAWYLYRRCFGSPAWIPHPVAEAPADALQHRPPALVLHRVVQQRGDGRVLVAAVLDHERRHRQQVRDVRRGLALARLRRVGLEGEPQRVAEARAEDRGAGRSSGHAIKLAARKPRREPPAS